jgi:hypothetical protein
MEREFCPQCGTARTGALGFCRACGFDFDALQPPEVRPIAAPAPATSASEISTTAQPGSSGIGRKVWVGLGLVIFVAVVAAAAFVSLSGSGALLPKHDMEGTFTLTDTSSFFGNVCSGSGGYADIRAGTNVVLRDGDGKVLATGSLGAGKGNAGSQCEFPYTLKSVPEVPFYTIEVGNRGDLSYSLEEMIGMGWSIDLTLGG